MAKINKDLSLIEIAQQLIEEKNGPIAILDLINKTLKAKGSEATAEKMAQLYQDILVHGSFVPVSDAKGKQFVDLKRRQSASYLEKEDTFIEDINAIDEEAEKAELREENIDTELVIDALDQMNADEQEDTGAETDDIADELHKTAEEEEMSIVDMGGEDEDNADEVSDIEDIEGEIKSF